LKENAIKSAGLTGTGPEGFDGLLLRQRVARTNGQKEGDFFRRRHWTGKTGEESDAPRRYVGREEVENQPALLPGSGSNRAPEMQFCAPTSCGRGIASTNPHQEKKDVKDRRSLSAGQKITIEETKVKERKRGRKKKNKGKKGVFKVTQVGCSPEKTNMAGNSAESSHGRAKGVQEEDH